MRTMGLRLEVPLQDYGATGASTADDERASKLAQADMRRKHVVYKRLGKIFTGTSLLRRVPDLEIVKMPWVTDAVAYGKHCVFQLTVGFPGKMEGMWWPFRVFALNGVEESRDPEEAFLERAGTLEHADDVRADTDYLLSGYSDGFLAHMSDRVQHLIDVKKLGWAAEPLAAAYRERLD